MNNLKKCKICKIYKDKSSIGRDGVCQDCKSNQQVADMKLPPTKFLHGGLVDMRNRLK